MTFLSTLSLRRATGKVRDGSRGVCYFYPRSPCGERHHLFWYCAPQRNFYPRSPCGERLQQFQQRACLHCISIHALLAESDGGSVLFGAPGHISIHALLAESDPLLFRATSRQTHFYPRSPCGERPKSANTLPAVTLFLSTLSLRRATGRGPHSPLVWQISIHALLAESDL